MFAATSVAAIRQCAIVQSEDLSCPSDPRTNAPRRGLGWPACAARVRKPSEHALLDTLGDPKRAIDSLVGIRPRNDDDTGLRKEEPADGVMGKVVASSNLVDAEMAFDWQHTRFPFLEWPKPRAWLAPRIEDAMLPASRLQRSFSRRNVGIVSRKSSATFNRLRSETTVGMRKHSGLGP